MSLQKLKLHHSSSSSSNGSDQIDRDEEAFPLEADIEDKNQHLHNISNLAQAVHTLQE